MTAHERRIALDNRILDVLAQGPKGKVWTEREIATGLDQNVVSISALERLQADGKVKLMNDRNGTYQCQLL